jgi:hypothetical protein
MILLVIIEIIKANHINNPHNPHKSQKPSTSGINIPEPIHLTPLAPLTFSQ